MVIFICKWLSTSLFVSEHAKIAAQDIDITNTAVDKIDFAALEQSLN